MNYLYEKVSYLRGLADGMEINDGTKEGKLLLNILDVLEDFADSMVELNDEVTDLDSYVETIDEDLAEVETELFGDFDEFDEDDDIDFIEIECPGCGEIICLEDDLIDDAMDESQVICPSCHEKIILEEDCCCDHDNGCCGHHQE
jgi:hypothetical protein